MAARRLTAATLALAAVTTAAVATAGPAAAKGSDVRTSGSCSAGGHWKLKAGDEGSRLQVEYEVEAGRRGQLWAVTISDNGTTVYKGSHRTAGASPSFEVLRLVTDRSGTDHLVGYARNTTTGATCRGVLAIG
ncbi:hypothetical protein GCM10027446_30580 [Angustibacter peucedani]